MEVEVGVLVSVPVMIDVLVDVAVDVSVIVIVEVEVTVSVSKFVCFIRKASFSEDENGFIPNLSISVANEADTGTMIKPANINKPRMYMNILM